MKVLGSLTIHVSNDGFHERADFLRGAEVNMRVSSVPILRGAPGTDRQQANRKEDPDPHGSRSMPQLPLPLAHHARGDGIAHHVRGAAAHVAEVVDGQDERDAFDGNVEHAERGRHHNQ